MPKQDYPPLWPPGRHQITLEEFRAVAIDLFPLDARRQELYLKLETWINRLRSLGVKGSLWIDGSIATEKPGPADIDCILWNPKTADGEMSDALKAALAPLVDRATVEQEFGLDFYMEGPWGGSRFEREAYWSGVYGFCHDRVTAKGFVEIEL